MGMFNKSGDFKIVLYKKESPYFLTHSSYQPISPKVKEDMLNILQRLYGYSVDAIGFLRKVQFRKQHWTDCNF